ncbi:MAG: GGDEF domain-containing protein, partial [Novosphingobium sp.]
ARIDGLVGVPVGTSLVLDLGGGQLVVSTVVRASDAQIGVEFETPLTSDGAGGLCTRRRVSPLRLAAASAAAPLPRAAPQFVEVAVPGMRERG